MSSLMKALLPIAIIIAGAIAMMALIKNKKDPPKQGALIQGVLVKTLKPVRGNETVTVAAFGEVIPIQEVELSPQVSGRVEWVNDRFQAGSFCKQGEALFRIEKRDYEIMLDQAKAGVTRAEHDLAVIQAQAALAKQEWDRLAAAQESLPEDMRMKTQRPDPLALYEPQMKNAEAGLKSAKAAEERVNLDLARCEVLCPFNARIRNESIDVGQILRPGDKVAKIFATDAVDILLRLPLDKLRFLKMPSMETGEDGAIGKVLLRWGKQTAEWNCKVVRSLGEVERNGRMVGLVARVDNPFAKEGGIERPQLRLNDYVEVALNGLPLKESLMLPSESLRENSTLWIHKGGQLKIKEVVVEYQTDRQVFLSSGLDLADEVIIGAVPSAVAGMKLRTLKQSSDFNK